MEHRVVLVAGFLACSSALAQTAGPNSAADTGATPQKGMGARTAESPRPAPHNPREPSPDEALSHAERTFMEDAAQSGTYEVKAAQVAASKATAPAVKDFAHKLLEDHTRANGELMRIARRKNMTLPNAPDWHQRHELDSMGRLDGPDFDRSFTQHAVKDHEDAIRKFQKALGGLRDPDLKGWADRTLAQLRVHLQLARSLPESAGAKPPARHSPHGATG